MKVQTNVKAGDDIPNPNDPLEMRIHIPGG
ncbi:MAG: hypothetical protein QOK37_4791 [Thermoanaerobaculia bacterium]|jgi:hypothetical protein|nr:hypothetical protein [Thermoanaerobaculia bacterium]